MGTCTILHKNTIVPVAKAGEKKAKNLKVGDAVLCERGGEFFLSRITSIETEMHSSWWKTDEGIFASDSFGGTQGACSPYHVASKAYIIKLEGEENVPFIRIIASDEAQSA